MSQRRLQREGDKLPFRSSRECFLTDGGSHWSLQHMTPTPWAIPSWYDKYQRWDNKDRKRLRGKKSPRNPCLDIWTSPVGLNKTCFKTLDIFFKYTIVKYIWEMLQIVRYPLCTFAMHLSTLRFRQKEGWLIAFIKHFPNSFDLFFPKEIPSSS